MNANDLAGFEPEECFILCSYVFILFYVIWLAKYQSQGTLTTKKTVEN